MGVGKKENKVKRKQRCEKQRSYYRENRKELEKKARGEDEKGKQDVLLFFCV